MSKKLMFMEYYDGQNKVQLTAYSDFVVYEQVGKKFVLRAVRFGGYPERVQGLADAIYGGGSVAMLLDTGPIVLTTQAKQYVRQLSHDGIYAEATLLALDEGDVSEKQQGRQKEVAQEGGAHSSCGGATKKYIFCPAGDETALFEEINQKTAVPMIPQFQEYVLSAWKATGDLKPLVVVSETVAMDGWVLRCTKDDGNLMAVVNDGIQSQQISIPGEVVNPEGFSQITCITEYLNTFGHVVAERIRKQFTPLFEPDRDPLSPEILEVNDHIYQQTGYHLYDAQLAVAESVKRQLHHNKCGFIIADCGTGKTKIGATALAAYESSIGKKKSFHMVLCPSHVTKKWAREIGETVPNAIGLVVRNMEEFDKAYSIFQSGSRTVFVILSKETARDGYMKQPAVRWNKRLHSFLCPHCHCPLEMPVFDDGKSYTVPADALWFRKEHNKNHKCTNCQSPLWQPVQDKKTVPWVKLGSYGWAFVPQLPSYYGRTKDPQVKGKIQALLENPAGPHKTPGACRRFPLSTYIKRRYKGKIDGFIADELHEYNNNSGQGDAMGELFQVAKKTIGMTATLINGYSSGIFYLLFRTVPHLMRKDHQEQSRPQVFHQEYGVVENTYETKDADYASNRRTQKVKKQSRQLPGVSPLVYSRFLLEHAAFLSLSDIGKALPSYKEIPIALSMEPEVGTEYQRISNVLQGVLRSDKKVAQKILSSYLNLLTSFPDQPYGQPPIYHPMTEEVLVQAKDVSSRDCYGPKEQKVLQLVKEKIELGEKVLVYSSWTRTDSSEKLQGILEDHGITAVILTAKVSPKDREEWVAKQLQQGAQVLITNPSLVETGLDLNAFTTLIFYSMGYKLFTLRQASRRSWRINQTAPQVQVYMLYYEDTMQSKAMKLMASKLAVAGIIEGNFSEEGLAAMSDVQDMTSQMAKELMLGIRDNVEDISSAFKRMAVVNPQRKTPPVQKSTSVQIEHKLPPIQNPPQNNTVEIHQRLDFETWSQEMSLFVAQQVHPEKTKKSKNHGVLEHQMSFFDFVA